MTGSHKPTDGEQLLGPYSLARCVARGGMGEIWQAADTRSGAPVAVKRLFSDRALAVPVELRDRLVREARALQRLQHDNIVSYLDTGFDDEGGPYLVMEWLEGESLHARQLREPLSTDELLDLAQQTLAGLAACHDAGVVHRDIKPGNLFIVSREGETQTKLVDLGLALLADAGTLLTRAGATMGTPHYMAPEQVNNAHEVDLRCDLYALGVILYELSTGRLPFTGDNVMGVLLKVVTEKPARPRSLNPDIPGWLERIIVRSMERAPSRRYDSADQMCRELEQGRTGGKAAGISIGDAETLAGDGSIPPTERRLVSLLCVQPLSPDAGLEGMVARAITEAGGVSQVLLGGEVVGLFGLSRTLGDEAQRAVRAGLLVRARGGPQTRLLAATLHMVVGQDLRFATGDLEHIFDRLAGLPAGELVLDDTTRELAGDSIQVRLVGAGESVVTQQQESPLLRRVLGVDTPTTGRDGELASLRAAFNSVQQHSEPEAVLLLGQAGIGKTRLCLELLPQLRQGSALCLEAWAESTREQTPYGLLAGAITRQVGIRFGQEPSHQRRAVQAFVERFVPGGPGQQACAFIGEIVGVPFDDSPAVQIARADPLLMRERVAQALETLLQGAGRQGLVCLCLEDLHWADEESLNRCAQLLERLEHTPLFLLATSQPQLLERHPGLFGEADVDHVTLRPLGKRHQRRLLRAVLGEELPRQMEDLLCGWSQGIPYFIEEMVSWAVCREVLVNRGDGWQLTGDPSSLELPAGVEGAIQGRLDQLDPAAKSLLRSAAVFGETFWEEGCEALGAQAPGALLRQLEAAGFVKRHAESRFVGTAQWSFHQSLLRQVAYQMLPAELCTSLHRGAAYWLEQVGETDPFLLARQLELGGDHARAADYSARAGARALADGDLERSASCYKSSLREDLTFQQRSDRSLGLVRALVLLGRYDQAWHTLDKIAPEADRTGPGPRRAEVLFARGRVLLGQGQFDRAEKALGEALAALTRQGDPELEFDIRHTLFVVLWSRGQYRATAPIVHQLRLGAHHSGRPDHSCLALLASAYFNAVEGDLSAAISFTEQALALAREIGHPYREVDCLTILGATQELVGFYADAARSLTAALALATRLKTSHHLGNIEASLGRLCLNRGQAHEALGHYLSAHQWAEDRGDSRNLAISLAGKANALCDLGQEQGLTEAAAAAGVALDLARDQTPAVAAEARLALCRVHLARGNGSPAVVQALEAVALLDQLGSQAQYEIEILLAAHDAQAAVGRLDEARQLLARAWQRLSQRADRISDAPTRESFIGQVPHNQRLLRRCYDAGLITQGQDPPGQ